MEKKEERRKGNETGGFYDQEIYISRILKNNEQISSKFYNYFLIVG